MPKVYLPDIAYHLKAKGAALPSLLAEYVNGVNQGLGYYDITEGHRGFQLVLVNGIHYTLQLEYESLADVARSEGWGWGF